MIGEDITESYRQKFTLEFLRFNNYIDIYLFCCQLPCSIGISTKYGNSTDKPSFKTRSAKSDWLVDAVNVECSILVMTIAVWQTEYLTGDLHVDQEHQELFEIVNSLHDAIFRAAPYSVVQGIFADLATHTVKHFQTEERLMQTSNYPGYDRHKQSHDGLVSKVKTLSQQLDNQTLPLSVKLTEFLAEWLAHHIKGEDQNMIRFFQAQIKLHHSAVVRSSL